MHTSNAQHTPGPWSASCALNLSLKRYGVITDKNGRELAYSETDFQSVSPVEQEANFALMAAAPEMSAVLKKAVEQFDYTVRALSLGQKVSISSLQNCAASIRATLAKAGQ